MMRILAAILLLLVTLSPSWAQDFFFQEKIGEWAIVGHPGDAALNLHPACVVGRINPENGARLIIVTDIADGELYMSVSHPKWKIHSPVGTLSRLRMHFVSKDMIKTTMLDYFNTTPEIVVIPKLPPNKLFPALSTADRIEFILPGKLPSVQIPTDGAKEALEAMVKCVENSNDAQKPKNKDIDL